MPCRSAIDCRDLQLLSLKSELRQAVRTRLPLLDEQKRPLYVVHRSMVANSSRISSREVPTIWLLKVADMLADERLQALFAGAFAVVPQKSTMREARAAMTSIPDCRDIFVTDTGSKDEPVTGWLTNVDLEGGMPTRP